MFIEVLTILTSMTCSYPQTGYPLMVESSQGTRQEILWVVPEYDLYQCERDLEEIAQSMEVRDDLISDDLFQTVVYDY